MRISIEDARRLLLEHTARLGGEEVALDDALSRVLAQDAVAPNPVPPFDCSTTDGFALRAADTAAAPAILRLVDEARAAARPRHRSRAGTTIRVSTGTPIPGGADAVMHQQLTSTDGDTDAAAPGLPCPDIDARHRRLGVRARGPRVARRRRAGRRRVRPLDE